VKKKYVKPVLLVLGTLLTVYLLTGFNVYPVIGSSMAETLNSGDHVVVSKRSNVGRYSVVAISMPGQTDYYVKRIIGMPGDPIIVTGKRLLLSIGQTDEFTAYSFNLSQEAADQLTSRHEIPEGCYFVIGDNVNVSKDSREFGIVPKEAVKGKLVFKVYPFKQAGLIN